MTNRLAILAITLSGFFLTSACSKSNQPAAKDLVFEEALDCVADGWNSGNAIAASKCFTEDAEYTEPGQKQIYIGRKALYEFFGGSEGRENAMSMEWHNWAFNPATQTGLAEFSFKYGSYAHGVVVIALRGNKISNWREYWYESDQNWPQFISPTRPEN